MQWKPDCNWSVRENDSDSRDVTPSESSIQRWTIWLISTITAKSSLWASAKLSGERGRAEVRLTFIHSTILPCGRMNTDFSRNLTHHVSLELFARTRNLISIQFTAVLVYNSLIQPHFDYCSLVWDGLSDQLSDKLQKWQNLAARVILKANYGTSSSLLLDILKWDKLVIRRKKHKAIMMFKSLNEQAPVYLQNLFHERSTDYDLRNSFHKLTLPRPRTNYLKRSFSYSGALLWNSLPENVREIKSVRKFKEQIKHVFESSDSHSAVL